MALLHIAELSWVFWKKIFRALHFSSCCCCSDLEMLAAEIFRIYSDASFAFALWARVGFRSTVSIHGFESGIDMYHTYLYNSIPKPSHLLLPALCLLGREFPVLLNGGFAEEARGQSRSRHTYSRNCLGLCKANISMSSCAQLHANTTSLVSLGSCKVHLPISRAESKASPYAIPTRAEPPSHPGLRPSHPLPANATKQVWQLGFVADLSLNMSLLGCAVVSPEVLVPITQNRDLSEGPTAPTQPVLGFPQDLTSRSSQVWPGMWAKLSSHPYQHWLGKMRYKQGSVHKACAS